MRIPALLLFLLLMSIATSAPAPNASAAPGDDQCSTAGGLREVDMTCQRTRTQVQWAINEGRATYRYRVTELCWSDDDGEVCANPRACDDPPGTTLYSVQRAAVGTEEWQPFGTVCLGSPDEVSERTITVTDVVRAFRRLDWPAATLQIQPPDGETLVNLDTIFYSTSTAPVVRTVPLLGHQVTIRATPRAYTWHWVTGTDRAAEADRQALTTGHAGAAYPHHTVTHRYSTPDTTVHPRLDLTYGGSYQVDGGPWQGFRTTLTVTGARRELTVLEARPTLVR